METEEDNLVKVNLLVMATSWILWIPVGNAISVYWQVFLDALGAPPYAIALIAAVTTIVVAMSRLVGGYIADKNGRKRITALLTYLVGLSYFLMALATNWVEIMVISIMMNIFLLYQPAMNAILADSMPKNSRGRAYALTSVLPNIFALLAPMIAYYSIATYGIIGGMRVLFVVMWIIASIVATLRLLFLRETIPKKKASYGFFIEYRKIAQGLIKEMPNILVFMVLLNFAMGLSVMIQLYSINYLGLGYESWALLTEIYFITYILLAFPMGHLADNIGRKPLLRIGSALYSLALASAFLAKSFSTIIMLILYQLLSAIGAAMINTALPALQADYISRSSRGKTYALISLLSSLAMAIGQVLSGIIYQYNPAVTFAIASLIWIIAYQEAKTIKEKQTFRHPRIRLVNAGIPIKKPYSPIKQNKK